MKLSTKKDSFLVYNSNIEIDDVQYPYIHKVEFKNIKQLEELGKKAQEISKNSNIDEMEQWCIEFVDFLIQDSNDELKEKLDIFIKDDMFNLVVAFSELMITELNPFYKESIEKLTERIDISNKVGRLGD